MSTSLFVYYSMIADFNISWYTYLELTRFVQLNCGIQGRQKAGSTSQFSTLSPTTVISPSTVSPSPNSFASEWPDSSVVIGESYETYRNQSSPSSVEISSSQVIRNTGMNLVDVKERIDDVSSSSTPDLSRALRRIEQQLSLNDDEVNEIDALYIVNEDSNDLEDMLRVFELSGPTPNGPNNLLSQQSGIYLFIFFLLFLFQIK